jgi:hypothetical protein
MGQTGGTFANRVYIGDAQGNSVWVGAGITNGNVLNIEGGPSGSTANTTLTTIKGVYDLAAAIAGATLFTSNVTLNLSGSKSFGKYTTGQEIPLAGRTPIQVILDALVEYILLSATLTAHGQTQPTGSHPTAASASGYSPAAHYVPYGATGNRTTNTITMGVTYTYTMNTPGYTALGATLEYQLSNTAPGSLSSGWTNIPGTYFDNTDPFNTTSGFGTYAVPITQWDTTNDNFKYTVRDAGGVTVAYRIIQRQTFVNPTTTISSTGVTATTSYTIPAGWSAGNGLLRERGNTGTSVNTTIAIGPGMWSEYHWLTRVGMQYSIDNGTTWYWTNNTTGTNTMQNTPVVGSTGTTFTIAPTIAGITGIIFRFHVNEGLTYTSAGGTGVVITPSSATSFVSLRKRIFYGATASLPATSAAVRSLPFSLLGPTSGTAISGASPYTFAFDAGTSSTNLTFVIAIPRGLTLNTASDSGGVGAQTNTPETLAGKSDPTQDPCQLTSLNKATDATGIEHDYNVYSWSIGAAYNSGTIITVRCNGTVTS